jgi:hypothetical protein
MLGLIICFLCISAITAQPPVPPTTFPPAWYTWVVTSVVKVGVSKPLYDYGQLVGYDSVNQWSCRLNQQNLLNPVSTRPVDYCDYKALNHYTLPNTLSNATCAGTTVLPSNITSIPYPAEYLAAAKFLGVDKVNQLNCNHFVAQNIMVDGKNIQMDVWTAQQTGFPCQISVTDLTATIITTWAFDGFNTVFPAQSVNQCLAAKIMCAEANWVCNAKPGTTDQQLINALSWVCGSGGLNCAPINPGGDHYLPNTPIDHANWAFNAYYLNYRTTQGPGACDFGGIAQIVPPASTERQNINHRGFRAQRNFYEMFSNSLTCD